VVEDGRPRSAAENAIPTTAIAQTMIAPVGRSKMIDAINPKKYPSAPTA